MKKVLCMVLILLAVCAVLVGCGTSDLSGTIKTQDVKLQIGDGEAQTMDLVSAWNTANKSENLGKKIVITLQKDVAVNQRLVLSTRTESFTVDLNGKTLHRNLSAATNQGEVIGIEGTGNFTFKNGKISGGWNNGYGGAVCVNASAAGSNVTFEKIEISGNHANIGAGVYVAAVSAGNTPINVYLKGKVIIAENEGKAQGEDLVLGYNTNSELMPLIQNANDMDKGSSVYVALEGNKMGIFTASFAKSESRRVAGYFANETYLLDKVLVSEGYDQLRLSKGSAFDKFVSDPIVTLKMGNGYKHYYANFADAMEDAYRDEAAKQTAATITLQKHLVLDSKLNPDTRSAQLTFDLNGFSISRNLTDCVAAGEVVCINKTGVFVFKNGTITGGKNTNRGAGMWIESCSSQVTLENMTITGNETTQHCGAGISLQSNKDGKMTKLTLNGQVIVSGNISRGKNTNSNNDITLWHCDNDPSKDAVLYVDGLTDGSEIYVQMTDDNMINRKITAAISKDNFERIASYIHNNTMMIKQYKANDNNYYLCVDRSSELAHADAEAVVQVGNKLTYYRMLMDPWEDGYINSAYDYVRKNTGSAATLTLLKDVTASRELTFDMARNAALTIDLGGYTITRTGNRSGSGSVMYFGENGVYTVKNGTLTGGNDTDFGGGINVNSKDGIDLTLRDLTITGNYAVQGGGGLFIREGDGKMANVKLVSKVVISGNTSGNANCPDMMTWNSTSYTDDVFDVSGLTDGSDIGYGYYSNEAAVNAEHPFTAEIPEEDIDRIASYFSCPNYYVSRNGNALCLSIRSVYEQADAEASVKADGELNYYRMFTNAWDFARNNTESEVTLTLLKDYTTSEELKFDKTRSAGLIFDMGGFTVTRTGDRSGSGSVMYFQENGIYTVKNGTLTGGNDSDRGGGIRVNSKDGIILTLQDLTITGNHAVEGGGGLFIDEANAHMANVKLVGKVIISGNTSDNANCPDMMTYNNTLYTDDVFDVSGLTDGSNIGFGYYSNEAAVNAKHPFTAPIPEADIDRIASYFNCPNYSIAKNGNALCLSK